MTTTQTKTATATSLNIFALASVVAENGLSAGDTFANRIARTDYHHIGRCMRAGLVEVVDRSTLRLTESGREALLVAMRKRPGRFDALLATLAVVS